MTRRQRFALSAVVLLLAAAPASATLTRVRAMGGGLSYLEDDAGATVWYAALLDYPDQAVLDLGDLDHDASGSFNRSTTGTAGGFHARLDEAGRWGTVGIYVQEDLPAGAPGGAITLLGARGFGALSLGLQASFSSHYDGDNSTETYGHGESLYIHRYGAAARWDVSDGVYGDIAGELVNVQSSDVEEYLWTLPYEDSWSTWSVRTRWFVALSEQTVWVPVFDFRRDDRTVYSDILAAPADQNAWQTRLGTGFNILPDSDNLVVVSGELRWGREHHARLDGASWICEYDDTNTEYFEVHTRVGLESRVLPWLTVRGALQYVRHQQERWTDRGAAYLDGPDRWTARNDITVLTPITLGVGLHAGPFQADLVLNARWSETYGTVPFGPAPQTLGTYTGITLGYRF